MEATSTLADTLLDDLEDLSDGGGVPEEDDDEKEQQSQHQQQQSQEDANETTTETASQSQQHKALASLFLNNNTALQTHLQRISNSNNNNNDKDDYELIVDSNRFHGRLADELDRLHTALTDVYHIKFPELSDMLPDALDYKTAVQIMQNEVDWSKKSVHDQLQQHFPSHQIITMSVASSTTQGRLLSQEELQDCLDLAQAMDDVHRVQEQLADFVRQRIQSLAPSLTALVGAVTASQLLGLAGGLSELAQIPACNLQVLGQAKASAQNRGVVAVISSSSSQQAPAGPHQGVLIHSDLFHQPGLVLSAKHRQKLLKQVAAKVALCARCDSVNVQQGRPRTAAPGEKYRAEIVQKLQQWQVPDAANTAKTKALPKPDLTVKKRRGGKRMRHWKERFEETSLMKKANTRAFSSQAGEYGDDAMGRTLGLLDTAGAGDDGDEGGITGIRKNAVGDKKKMRISNTKAARKQRAHAAKISGQYQQDQQEQQQDIGSSGMASTVAFTPLQAMELVNPDAQKERVRQANQKWFAENAGFQSALLPKKKS